MRYVYSLVRFVPDPTRGEFINVGAIVGSDENSDWKVRRIENPRRARYMDEHHTLDAVWAFLDRIERNHQLSEPELKQFYADHRNIVQLSMPIPMVAADADEALDSIFVHQICDPAPRPRARNKRVAQDALRRSYQARRIGEENLQERVTLQANRHEETVDFAVTNGRVVQLTHTWPFPTTNYKTFSNRVRGWGYTIRDMRTDGGIVSTNEATFEVDPTVDIEVVYMGQEQDVSDPALQDAFNVFEDLKVNLVSLGAEDQVSQRALELLKSG